jgi:protein phosphatase 2C family protein 2/3
MRNGLPTTQTQQVRQETCPPPEDSDDEDNPFVGPYRVAPGRLSVCRTFGDCEAKLTRLGGTKGVVSCDPEVIHEKDGVAKLDYVLIGSDGIFDKLKNDQINELVWDVTTKHRQEAIQKGQAPSLHTISGLVADEILHAAARNRSLDNLSIVFVAFKSYRDYIESGKIETIEIPVNSNLSPVQPQTQSTPTQPVAGSKPNS